MWDKRMLIHTKWPKNSGLRYYIIVMHPDFLSRLSLSHVACCSMGFYGVILISPGVRMVLSSAWLAAVSGLPGLSESTRFQRKEPIYA